MHVICSVIFYIYIFFIVKTFYNAISQNSSCDAHQLFYFFYPYQIFHCFFFYILHIKKCVEPCERRESKRQLVLLFLSPFS